MRSSPSLIVTFTSSVVRILVTSYDREFYDVKSFNWKLPIADIGYQQVVSVSHVAK
jgi:hypothetical protein